MASHSCEYIRPGSVPDLQGVLHTNFCDIGFKFDAGTRRTVVVSAIDNLGKGAAGQAVQNMNLALGYAGDRGSALKLLIKIGGALLDDPDTCRRLAREIAAGSWPGPSRRGGAWRR